MQSEIKMFVGKILNIPCCLRYLGLNISISYFSVKIDLRDTPRIFTHLSGTRTVESERTSFFY